MELADAVARAATGDSTAWNELVRRYTYLLRSIGSGFRLSTGDTEDAAQMTWLALIRNIHKLHDPDALSGWLTTTMRRNCLQILRHRRHELLEGDWSRWLVADEQEAVDDRLLNAERSRILWDSVDRLPDRQRDLVRVLFAGDERPYAEVATSMSMAQGAIGPTRQRALRRLRKMLASTGVRRHGGPVTD
jgi:RNA polymerase sigma factor (sigma-70 family)